MKIPVIFGTLLLVVFVAIIFAAAKLQTPSWIGEFANVHELVECVNDVNGYPTPASNTPWSLSQAVAINFKRPDDHVLADGYQAMSGRRLGWHFTWSVYFDVSKSTWIAFDSKSADDSLGVFGESFVPKKVKSALQFCGVEWAGHWSEEPPYVDVSTGLPYVTQKREPKPPNVTKKR